MARTPDTPEKAKRAQAKNRAAPPFETATPEPTARAEPVPPGPAQFSPPFKYPPRHRRVHGPAGYPEYGAYKPWLRDEFAFRCVYCLTRELWSNAGHKGFTIDHVKPKSKHTGLTTKYSNLVYCCRRCNELKSTRRLPDPCKVSLAKHVMIESWVFSGISPAGKRMVAYLRLNEDERLPERRRILKDYRARDTMDAKELVDSFGYPTNLPDLSAERPPGGNRRPGGVRLSHLARQMAKKLPSYY